VNKKKYSLIFLNFILKINFLIMKKTNFFKQLPGLFLLSGALLFTSCDNNNRNDRSTIGTDNRDNLETTDDRAVDNMEITEADYNTRRTRATTNLDNELQRTRTEVDGLRQSANTATGEERSELQQQIDRLEARIESLEGQQTRLENSNMENWEEIERDIETNIQDRDFEQTRGEENATELGTGNSTGIGTSTENDVNVDINRNDRSNRSDRNGITTEDAGSDVDNNN
jgi:TolA-binding protein